MRKTFVLDTNVILHNADALTSFADNEVVITLDVLEELDRFKAEGNDVGRNARRRTAARTGPRASTATGRSRTLPFGARGFLGQPLHFFAHLPVELSKRTIELVVERGRRFVAGGRRPRGRLATRPAATFGTGRFSG